MKIPKRMLKVFEREFPNWEPEVLWKFINQEKRNEAKKIRKSKVGEDSWCEICGYSFSPALQIHHIIPISLGGDNSEDNVICLCPNCHKETHYLYRMFLSGDFESYKKANSTVLKRVIYSNASASGLIRRNEMMSKFVDFCVESVIAVANEEGERCGHEINQLFGNSAGHSS